MDSIIHAALEEICSQASNGLYLSHLWPKLLPSFSAAGLHPCDSVKRAFWSNLLKISGIQFIAGDVSFVQSDSRIQSFEECEKLNLKIVAGENLRDCFLGLYDSKALNSNQRPVLERLGAARENGVTQEQLSKELGIRGNNFFYVVKSLESRGLVVRQSTIVRKKESLSAASGCSPVTTNLICLHRYALPLGSQQRLEITKENKNLTNDVRESVNSADVIFGECDQDDVLVKDFLPAMKAICERLEQADGKVLVVSDIKRDLGYQKTQGHRAWRNICGRLKDADVVEIFDAKVDGKVSATTSLKRNKTVSCLRLVKKFSPKLFEPKTLEIGYDGAEAEQLITLGRKGQITEQLVELPIEQQIFDMIDAEGSKGLIVFEVWKRLGINSKRNHNRLNVMTSRFGLVQLPENHKRVTAYRVWTPRNFGLESSNFFLRKPGNLLNEKENHAAAAADSNCEMSYTPDLDFATLDHDFVTTRSTEKRDAQQDLSGRIPKNGKYDQRLLCPSNLQGSLSHTRITVPDPNFSIVGTTVFNASSVETSSHRLSKSLSSQPRQRYPSLTSAQREKRILERLKKEKIILKCELHRWLDSLENGQRKMDRKTLLRCLKKLEEDGSCKLILYSVPGVTNYGRHREVPVVLHPSFKAHDLSDQVLERLRSFEMETRGQGSSRLKNDKSVPLLNDIQRIQIKSNSEAQSTKSEAMRANGFVLAKMSRTRLLHNFLWGYVNISSSNKEALPLGEHFYLSKNPHSTCKLFSLDAAIKAIPLELFLQVVGCSHKLEGMVEKCKSGLLLSDLPKEEYKCMMNTQATARLSWLIDILRRLKLIRLVADESLKEGAEITHATLTHALELKPYIEEPPLGVSLSLDSGSHDLRPHLRHDFVLSTREAVEKYWQTLEYCYAASDAKAALHAFPGSSVREVFHSRSWTTVRVMTAEQRAELVKCIVEDGSYKKLAFNECREMAKALNLNLEQVLRVYYDMRQKHLNSFQGVPNTQVEKTCAVYNTHPSSLKRKKMSSEATLSKHLKVNPTDECFEDFHLEPVEEHDVHEQQEQHSSFISQWALPKLKHTRQTKFSWTEEADRQLLIQYARQRAAQGARRGTDWASMTHLPAPPDTCRRRMAVLRRDKNFTKALMRLCNLLTQRYSHHLDKAQKINLVDGGEDDQQSELQEEQWDNFGEPKIKMAFDEVLIFKQIAKMDAAKGAGSICEGTHRTFTATPSEVENDCGRQHVNSSQRASCYRLPGNFIKHLNGGINITRQVHESLAISNAVELLKLVFLSTSNSAEVPNLLAETLRCYSEIDLFSAFNYLKEKKIMVGNNGSQPYVLSQHFLHSLSLSQFPTNTGKRAARFASWICERETELMAGTVNLTSDLQCGDILNLLALVSSEELSISPVLPDEGIGEAEDSRSLKRKFDDNESDDVDKVKKRQYHSLQESEICSRREKGFPGITVSLSRSVISRSNVYEFLKDEVESPLQPGEDVDFFATLGQKISSSSPIDYMKEASDFSSVIPISIGCGESQWEAMSNYAEQVMRHSVEEQPQIYPVVFQTTYTAIQNAGDQGLSLQEVSVVINMQGAKMAEFVVDVLQVFGQAVKVNGYDSVHVVDALYRSKYSLTSKAAPYQVLEMAAPMNSPRVNGNRKVAKEHGTSGSEVDSQMGASMSVDDVHKITILNLSEEVRQHSNADGLEVCAHSNMISTVGGKDENFHASFPGIFCPILPWINGDGTTNDIVYRGLIRRILGIVMQNPGISEDNILHQMEALNPQSCRKLLGLMILDNHLVVRKMLQTTSYGVPSLLKSLLGSHFRRPEYVSREHYFANPMSASLL